MFFFNKTKNKVKNTVIHVADTIAPIVSSRDIAANLEATISASPSSSVSLDFSSVDFISRSAAHQLLTIKDKFQKSRPVKEVEFANANKDVSEMFRVIEVSRANPNSPKPTFKPKRVDVKQLLKVSIE